MIFIENEKYSDPLTSVFGRTLQGRVGPMKKGKKTKKAKRRKMSKLSQVSLKDTVEKDGHCGQEKRQKYKTKRLFKLSQVSFRKDTAEKGDTLDVAAAVSYLSRYLRISAVFIHIIKRMTVKAYLRRVA